MWAPFRTLCPALLLLLVVSGCDDGSIRVTVRGSDPAGTPVPNATVSLAGTTLSGMTAPDGTVSFDPVAPGEYTVRASSSTVTCPPQERTVSVIAGEAQVTLWLCADVVETLGAPNEPIIAAVDLHTNNGASSQCEEDRLFGGIEAIILQVNALPPATATPPCSRGVAILSNSRAFFYDNTLSAVAWTAARGDVYSAPLAPGRIRVPVRIFISDAQLTEAQRTDVKDLITGIHLPQTHTLFADSFSGFELVGSEADGGPPEIIDASTLPGDAHGAIGSGCGRAAMIKPNPAVYGAGQINVYYVRDVTDPPNAKGYNCVAEGAPNIIFVDHDQSDAFTLAHEIGHALGLLLPDWGHTDLTGGFYLDGGNHPLNVMSDYALAPAYFSVGQVARMNLGTESWLNQPSHADGSSVRHRQAVFPTLPIISTCGCLETDVLADCPALVLDIPRAGTLKPPEGTDFACSVTTTATQTVGCSASAAIEAQFWKASGIKGFGDGRFGSLSPDIVTVTLDAQSPGKMTGTITGISPGSAIVRAYGGGAYTAIAVTVTGPCPPP